MEVWAKDQVRISHRLAGNAATFGMERFGRKAEVLSSRMRNGHKERLSSEDFADLNSMLEDCMQALDQYWRGRSMAR